MTLTARIEHLAAARADLGALCSSLSETLIYPNPRFLDFLEAATGGFARVVLAEQREVVGALPFLTLEREGLGRVTNSLPWWGSHGSCTLNRSRHDADAIRHKLLSGFLSAIAGEDLISATVTLCHQEESSKDIYRATLSPTAEDARIGQITKLPAEVDDKGANLLSIFGQKTRNLVRKSLKQGFVERVTESEQAWDILHQLHVENIQALGGLAKPREHFRMMRRILPENMRRLSLALDGDHPVAALLLLYGGRTVEYVTPAIDVAARSRQPLSFLIWHGMLDAIARGYSRWNWGGTWLGQSSLHRFKAGFGAQDLPYSYFSVATPRGLEILRSRRSELGELFPYFYTYPYAALDNPI